MSVPTKTLTINVYGPDGAAISGAKVTAQLSAIDVYSGQFIYPTELSATTNASGVATIALFPNTLGERNTHYNVKAQNADQSKTYFTTTVVMPNIDKRLDQVSGTHPPLAADTGFSDIINLPFLDQQGRYESYLKNFNTASRTYTFPDVGGLVLIAAGVLSAGLIAATSADNSSVVGRTLQAPAAGITITNPAGIAGDPTFVLANDLAALEGIALTGMAARTAADTWAVRTITGTANQVSVANGDGVLGNPTLSLPSAVTMPGSLTVNAGTLTAASPTFTGTTTAAAANFSGAVGVNNALTVTYSSGATGFTVNSSVAGLMRSLLYNTNAAAQQTDLQFRNATGSAYIGIADGTGALFAANSAFVDNRVGGPVVLAVSGTAVGSFAAGATTLTGTLNVTGATQLNTSLSVGGLIGTGTLGAANSGGLSIGRRDTGASAYILYSTAGNLQFYNGTSDVMTLTNAGNLTLNGTATIGTLSVSGNATLGDASTDVHTANGYINISGSASGVLLQGNSRNTLAFSGDRLDFGGMSAAQWTSVATYAGAAEITRVTSTGLALAATGKLYFDGVAATGDTYIVESAANELNIFAGGTNGIRATSTTVQIGGAPSLLVSLSTNNTKIGASTATRATNEGTNHLDIFDGTAPVGTLANGISLYSTAGELRVMDAAGNATLLSPHSKDGRWIHEETNYLGRHLHVDMEGLLSAVDAEYGWGFVRSSMPLVKASAIKVPTLSLLNTSVALLEGDVSLIDARLARVEAHLGLQ